MLKSSDSQVCWGPGRLQKSQEDWLQESLLVGSTGQWLHPSWQPSCWVSFQALEVPTVFAIGPISCFDCQSWISSHHHLLKTHFPWYMGLSWDDWYQPQMPNTSCTQSHWTVDWAHGGTTWSPLSSREWPLQVSYLGRWPTPAKPNI